MTEADIKHFLVVVDPSKSAADVREFGADYDAALAAYGAAEEGYRDSDVEVVLLGSDSLETIKRTHSSFFALKTPDPVEELLATVS